MDKLNLLKLCPIIQYTHFKTEADEEMEHCTTIHKFNSDMKKLVDKQYTFLSLEKVIEYNITGAKLPEKPVCITFNGGYKSNYTLAFPTLLKYGIHTDIFITTDFIGMDAHPVFNSFIPHFGWEEAKQMIESGFVDIHISWHNIHYNNGFSIDANIIKMLDVVKNVKGYKPLLFWNPLYNRDIKNAFQKNSINFQIIDLLKATFETASQGCFASFYVHNDVNVLDAIEQYKYLYNDIVIKEQSAIVEPKVIFNYDKYRKFESIGLPIERKPRIKNFLCHAFGLSIIAADRNEKADLFVVNNYIDTIMTPAYNLFDYHNYSYIHWDMLNVCKITYDIIHENQIDVISYIINGLKHGYYSDIWLDTYFIPGKPGYKQTHQTHGLLIFGYNSESLSFSALTYTDKEQYEEITIKAENILLACSNQYFQYINLLKINPMERVEYNIKYLYNKLTDYINSKTPDEWNAKFHKKALEQYFNYDADLHMIEYVRNSGKNGWLHKVCLYSYCEHKKCMFWRIKYICDREDLTFDNFESILGKAHSISDLILNQVLKFNMIKSEQLIEKIILSIDQLNKMEKDAITNLLSLLKIN